MAESPAEQVQTEVEKDAWARISEEFDEWAEQGKGEGMAESHAFLGMAIAQELPAGGKDTVLDLSCGAGWFSRYLAKEVVPDGQVIGVDLSPKMLEAAKTASEGIVNLRFEVARAEELPFEDHSIDHIVNIESFYYYPDQVAAGHEMFRVLKPGGTFFVAMDFFLENRHTHRWTDLMEVPMQCMGTDQYNTLFRACGFIDVGDQRIRDSAELPEKADGKWFRTMEQLRGFREEGSLLISGRKPPEEL